VTLTTTLEAATISENGCKVSVTAEDGIVYTVYNAETFEIFTSETTPISFDEDNMQYTVSSGPNSVTAYLETVKFRILATNINYGLSVLSDELTLTITACFAPEVNLPSSNTISYIVGSPDSTNDYALFDSAITTTL
jgi:hypothetical protein